MAGARGEVAVPTRSHHYRTGSVTGAAKAFIVGSMEEQQPMALEGAEGYAPPATRRRQGYTGSAGGPDMVKDRIRRLLPGFPRW